MIMIEPMTLEDLDAVAALEHASFRTPWSREVLLAALRNTSVSCLVGRLDGGRLAGYLCLQRVGPAIDVVRLAVDPGSRRRGVASALVDAVNKEARHRGVKRVTLLVRPSNVVAVGLYRTFGFRVIERRPGYYADTGEDALVMALKPVRDPAAPGGARTHQAPPVAVKVPPRPAQELVEPPGDRPSGGRATSATCGTSERNHKLLRR